MIVIRRVAAVASTGAVLVTAIVVGAAHAATLTWDGSCAAMTGDNSWDAQCRQDVGSPVLTNWDTDTLPGDSADVIIPAAAGQTIIDDPGGERVNSLNSEASLHIKGGDACVVMILSPAKESTIHGLNLEWGDILLRGTLTTWGTSSMERGTIYNYEGGGTLINMGDFTIDGVPPDPFANTGFTLSQVANRGTVTQRGHYDTWDTTISNEGSWLIETNPNEEADFGGSAKPFINRNGADLGKTGAEPVYMSMPLVNEEGATVIINQGPFFLFSEGNEHQGGSIQIDPGAELILFEGHPEWGMPGATLEWTGGSIEYPLPQVGLGVLRVEKSATMDIRGTAEKTFYKVKLEIQQGGRVIHASEGPLVTVGPAVIRNKGIYDLAKGDIKLSPTSDLAPFFENKGLLRKSKEESGEETGDSTIEVPVYLEDGGKIEVVDRNLTLTGGGEFIGSGTISVRARAAVWPELILAASGPSERTYEVKSGKTIVLDPGPFPAGLPGILRLKQGAVLSIMSGAELYFQAATFHIDGGTITGAGRAKVGSSSVMRWTGGTIGDPEVGASSADVLLEGGSLFILTGPAKKLAGTLTIDGKKSSVTQRADLTLAGGQVLLKEGSWRITEDLTLDATSGGRFSIRRGEGFWPNEVLVQVSSLVEFSAPLDNGGRVSARQGTLRLTGPIQQVSINTLTAGWWEIGDINRPDVSAILDMANHVINTIEQDAHVTIMGKGTFPQLRLETNYGSLNIYDGASYETPGSLSNDGDISIIGSEPAHLEVKGSFTNHGALYVLNKGSIRVLNAFVSAPHSRTRIEGPLAAGSLIVREGAKFSAKGIITTQQFENKGNLLPGGSPGVLTITGDYDQFAEGTLEIELGGAEVGTGYDQLVVDGNASLDGTLSISLIDDYVPQAGESFEILTAGSVSGRFSRVDVSGVSGRRDFQVVYGQQTVILTTYILTVASYEEWLAAKFSPSEQADPDISGANADPDSDGLENLLEYVFALRPGQADRNPVTPDLLTDEPGGDTFMTLTFPWADGMTDVDFSAETSTDLVTWSPATAEVITTVQEGQVKILTVKVTSPVVAAEQMFARLAVNKIVP